MIRRNRRLRDVPMLNTASLPDLIFTVLFFFMIVTHMRTTTRKVQYTLPQGTELKRLAKKSAVTYIYIGRALPETPNTSEYRVQLNNKMATMDEVTDFVAEEKKRMNPDDQAKMTVSIKADRSTPMHIVNAVKRAVRAGGATRINYSAERESDKLKQK